jgi:polyisoprenoid-binding protein YceI
METAEVTTKTKWAIDSAHTQIEFKVKHLMIANVRGVFKDFDANIYTMGEDFTTLEINFWINPTSIDTGGKKRDEHLKSSEFFDVEKHKQITFTSDTCKKTDEEDRYELYGNLTIKGVTKQVKLDVRYGGVVKDPWGKERAGFSVTGKINRKDYGLDWNTPLEEGGVILSDDVYINCEVELVKQL